MQAPEIRDEPQSCYIQSKSVDRASSRTAKNIFKIPLSPFSSPASFPVCSSLFLLCSSHSKMLSWGLLAACLPLGSVLAAPLERVPHTVYKRYTNSSFAGQKNDATGYKGAAATVSSVASPPRLDLPLHTETQPSLL